MAISCSPNDLQLAAKAFQGLNPQQRKWVDTYLLAVIAGGSTDPQTLLTAAKCFQCIPDGMLPRIMAYLLCQIASGGGGGSSQDMQVAWTPTNLKLGELIGFTASADAIPLNGILTLTFNQTVNSDGFQISGGASTVQTVSFPNLVSIGSSSFPSFLGLDIDNCASLVSVSAPNLVTVVCGEFLGATINVRNNPSLSSVDFSSLLPTNGSTVNFSGNALPASNINAILHRCVLNAAYVSGSVVLDGGTNAAPSGQGIADKAALILRGVSVTTN